MNQRKLRALKQELEQARRSPQRAAALQSLAKRLGRKLVKRGKHPMWVNEEFPKLFPLAIPDHGGRDLAPGTRNSILNQLDDDISAWDQLLPEEDDEEQGEHRQ